MNLLVEVIKYLMLILIGMYSFYCLSVIRYRNKKQQDRCYNILLFIIFFLHFLGSAALYVQLRSRQLIYMYLGELLLFILVLVFYRLLYPKLSRLLLRNMLMLLAISFIMLTRLSFNIALKQLIIVAFSFAVSLFIPLLIRYINHLQNYGWVYGLAGALLLAIVLIAGTTSFGATNWISVFGLSFQPSELVKVIFVLSMASLLRDDISFKKVCIISALAAAHVLILVLQKDLGAALIFFVAYIFILYAATLQPLLFLGGLLAGSGAAYAAYQLFYHVRVRVMAWYNPFAYIDKEGYQITQSLFAIGTGGWFGMGINKGKPTEIPVVESDFIFSALSEELGGIFVICIILVYLSCFIMLTDIALKQEESFYRLTVSGFAVMFIFQIFLSVGGVIKFIPSTGVTLPLISQGGSSVFATIIMFMIVQGIYMRNKRPKAEEESIAEGVAAIPVSLGGDTPAKSKANRSMQTGQKAVAVVGEDGTIKDDLKEAAEAGVNDMLQEGAGAVKKATKAKNYKKPVYNISYIFLGLFVLMVGYYTYFQLVRSKEIIDNPYNRRQEVLADRIVRGQIMSADNKVLARTVVDEEGNESREYPFADLFAHVVGRTKKGISGLELSENIRLLTSNKNSFKLMYSDLIGEKSPGDNVITTLNTELQQIAYDALGNNRGAVVVMEPASGKILAMVSKPSYDPNQIDEIWDELIIDEKQQSPLLNRATQGLYPPGSTFKLLTALEFIRENPDYRSYEYKCKGSIEYNSMIINCYDRKKHGLLGLPLAFAKSCNTSFANIGRDLDIDSFYKLCTDFYFNKPLPVEMVSNQSSYSLKTGTASIKEAMQTAIGQGNTLITPLHNAMIAATVANGGLMMKPYIVDKIINVDGGRVKKYNPQQIGRPMSPTEAAYIGIMMRRVVTDGTGKKLMDLEPAAAGKTGSADHASNEPSHAWFIGYAPYDDPKLVVSVIVESVGTGSDYAVPIAKKIFQSYFK